MYRQHFFIHSFITGSHIGQHFDCNQNTRCFVSCLWIRIQCSMWLGSRHRSPWLQFYLRCFPLRGHQPKYLTSLMFSCGICKMQNSSTLRPQDCLRLSEIMATLSLHRNYNRMPPPIRRNSYLSPPPAGSSQLGITELFCV